MLCVCAAVRIVYSLAVSANSVGDLAGHQVQHAKIVSAPQYSKQYGISCIQYNIQQLGKEEVFMGFVTLLLNSILPKINVHWVPQDNIINYFGGANEMWNTYTDVFLNLTSPSTG